MCDIYKHIIIFNHIIDSTDLDLCKMLVSTYIGHGFILIWFTLKGSCYGPSELLGGFKKPFQEVAVLK